MKIFASPAVVKALNNHIKVINHNIDKVEHNKTYEEQVEKLNDKYGVDAVQDCLFADAYYNRSNDLECELDDVCAFARSWIINRTKLYKELLEDDYSDTEPSIECDRNDAHAGHIVLKYIKLLKQKDELNDVWTAWEKEDDEIQKEAMFYHPADPDKVMSIWKTRKQEPMSVKNSGINIKIREYERILESWWHGGNVLLERLSQ